MRFSKFCVCAAVLMTVACSEAKFVGRPDLTLVDASQLPPPGTQDLIGEERPYLIGPMDRVSVDVFGVPELTRSVQVDASGRIAMPLVGVVEASGKTPAELGQLIEGRLRGRYVKNPQVTVNLTDTLSQLVTVDGAVTAPGLYPVAGRMTLMRAIAKAEGLTEFARDEFVVVFRRVEGRDMAALYNLGAIRLGQYPDPEIFANDVVLVGDSNSRRIFKDFLQASPLIAAPLVALINSNDGN